MSFVDRRVTSADVTGTSTKEQSASDADVFQQNKLKAGWVRMQ